MELNKEIKEALSAKVGSVTVDDTVRMAIKKMAADNNSAVIVKNEAGVAGVVTDMDILYSINRNEDIDTTTAASIMSPCELITRKAIQTPCVQLDSAQSVKNALGLMHTAGIRHVVVTGDNDVFLGVLSLVDLLKLLVS